MQYDFPEIFKKVFTFQIKYAIMCIGEYLVKMLYRELMMDNNFFALMFRMKYIHRWVLMRSGVPESLSTHSAETAITAHALAAIGNNIFNKSYDCDKIGMKALYHDAPEILTGDLPTPVKNHSEKMRQAYKSIESAALERFSELLPSELKETYDDVFKLSPDEKKLVKAADKLCAYIKCIEEKRCGNSEFDMAFVTVEKNIEEMCADIDELKYFCDNFLPGFYLPLDTLKQENRS